MTMPEWWSERRFGVFVQTATASVPGWSPIGAEAGWYRSHLGEAGGTSTQPTPLVEVLAHHRDRWGHVESYDDFVPLLTYEHFDAEEWARLVTDAGANYSIIVAKHHDGWTWWDAPGSTRPLTEDGPHRDVLGEYAAACERHAIALGTHYSLLDWGEPHGAGYVDEVLYPQVVDLVERHGSVMLWGDGHPIDDVHRSMTAPLLDRVRTIAPDLLITDGWHAPVHTLDGSPSTVRSIVGEPPPSITDGPWELVRGIGPSLGYNRAERPEHHLTGHGIVALYTEVLAKGGNLLLAVGPDADGMIPSAHADPLRDAGRWIRRFGPVVAASTPWSDWGDHDVRYLDDDTGTILAIDIGGHGEFAGLPTGELKVTAVERVDEPSGSDVTWRQDVDGLHVDLGGRSTEGVLDIAVYRIAVEAADRPDELFAPSEPRPIALAPLVADARAGQIVQLGDGIYDGPAHIPAGVVVRGLGSDRTTIVVSGSALEVGRGARLEHACVTAGSAPESTPVLVSVSGRSATLLGCTVAGSVAVSADDVLVRAVRARSLVGLNADRMHVSRCELAGGRDDVGIDLRGGGGHVIESNRLSGHQCAIRLSETTGSNVHGNTISGRWWGVHLDHCESAHVHGNRISWTMRAVDVDGGTQAVVDGNAVTDGDSGCVVEDGASDCEVYGNHWDRCRIGLLAWDAVALHHQDNVASSLHEPDGAFITGP